MSLLAVNGTTIPKLVCCPHCGANYKVVLVEAAVAITDGEVSCVSCDGPLPARHGEFVVKYFMVDRPRQRQMRKR
jgi:hypothetical protein